MTAPPTMEEWLRQHLQDKLAVEFVLSYQSACSWLDDLVDGDAGLDDENAWNLLETTLYWLPSNAFFLAHCTFLVPVMRMVVTDYETATRAERAARTCRLQGGFKASDDCLHYRLLRSSFELRNSVFNLAPLCVELLHGRAARVAFSGRWFELTRDYEKFDDYVEKVTAELRPEKR